MWSKDFISSLKKKSRIISMGASKREGKESEDKKIVVEMLRFFIALFETTNKFLPKQIDLIAKSRKWSKSYDAGYQDPDFWINALSGLDKKSITQTFVLINSQVPLLVNRMSNISEAKLPRDGIKLVDDVNEAVRLMKILEKKLSR